MSGLKVHYHRCNDVVTEIPYYIKAIVSVLVPLLVTLFILPKFKDIAGDLGLLDLPDRRKLHLTPKPLVGGLGMSLGVAFGCLLFLPLTNMRGYYAGAILLVVIGFFDDYKEVHHRMKFAAQFMAAILVICFSDISLMTLGDLLNTGPIYFNRMIVPMTIIGVAGVINAMNMIDGVDGLAGGISLITFMSFAYLAWYDNHLELMLLCLALCGAVSGFLRYNWHPSTLFMGDAGSLFLGFSAAFISIALTQEANSLTRPVSPLLVLTVPITDTITVMMKRLIKGKSPFYPDRTHLHHILLGRGLTPSQTATAIIAIASVFSAIAIAGVLMRLPDYVLFSVFAVYFTAYTVFSFTVRQDPAE